MGIVVNLFNQSHRLYTTLYHVTGYLMPLGADAHTRKHTNVCRQKQFQETRRILAFGWHTSGLKIGKCLTIQQFFPAQNFPTYGSQTVLEEKGC